ncbi:MAG: YceI family protein [Luteimonas sp.]
MFRSVVVAALFALAGGEALAAQPVRYSLDPVHTRVMFAVEHAGFSKAIGTVSGSTGTLVFDAVDWRVASVEVSVPLTRLDLGDGKWNTAALANNLLDGDDFPVATFVSTRVEPVDAQHAAVYGMLTLHGVTNQVKLDVTLNAVKRHPLPPFRRTAGFSATTMLSRKAFGIDAWPSVIGDRVELRIEAEATRAGRADGDDTKDVDSEAGGARPSPTETSATATSASEATTAEPPSPIETTSPPEPTP